MPTSSNSSDAPDQQFIAAWALLDQILGVPEFKEISRTRLPLEAIEWFAGLVCDYLGSTVEKILDDRRVFIIDGTAITLPPTSKLRKDFPPATNQHGESVWPVTMLMVAAEMQSGFILVPKVDLMFGPNNSGEAKQDRLTSRSSSECVYSRGSG